MPGFTPIPTSAVASLGNAGSAASSIGGLASIANPIGAIGGAVGAVMGPIMNFLSQRAQLNAQKNVAGQISGGAGFERDLMLSLFDMARQNSLGAADTGTGLSIGSAENPGVLLQALQQYAAQQENTRSLYASLGIDPQQAQFLDPLAQWAGGQQAQGEGMAGRAQNAAGSNDQLAQMFSSLLNGGMSTAGLDAGNEMLQNRGRNAESSYLNDAMQSIIGTGGKSADLQNIMNAVQGLVGSGGRTPQLDAASQKAMSLLQTQDPYGALGLRSAADILQSGGATRTSQQGSDIGLDILKNGGATPAGDAAMTGAMDRLNANPIMPTGEALGLLSSQIGSQAVRNATAANKQAYLRGGGPGATLASGASEQARRDASSAGLQAESQAMTDFLLGREKMGVEDRNQAGQLVSSLLSNATQRQGLGADLLKSLESSNTARYGTGGDLLSSLIGRNLEQAQTGFNGLNQTEGTALNRLQTGLNAGLQGTGQAAQNVQGAANTLLGNRAQNTNDMTAGSGLQRDYFNNVFGAAAGQAQTVANDLGMSGQGLQFMNAAADRMNQGLQGSNQSTALNRDTIQGFLDRIAANTGQQTGIGNTLLNYGQNGTNQLGQMASSFNGGYTGLLGSLAGVFR